VLEREGYWMPRGAQKSQSEYAPIRASTQSFRPMLTQYKCTLFTKSPDKNWLFTLHQDLSIPVAERVGSSRCTGWSEKEGDLFVQPPITVLEQLVAIRLHLDDCDEQNGALRGVPGSHRTDQPK
jgi:ectoine hydroxylase-related dioxygenase (phytanoyl-CoA dioxygenase family)